jgi:hypothetical protein
MAFSNFKAHSEKQNPEHSTAFGAPSAIFLSCSAQMNAGTFSGKQDIRTIKNKMLYRSQTRFQR